MATIKLESEEIERMMLGALMLGLHADGLHARTEDPEDGNLYLHVFPIGTDPWCARHRHNESGWIRLMPGNGVDVIVDHSVSLKDSAAIKGTNALHEKLRDMDAEA